MRRRIAETALWAIILAAGPVLAADEFTADFSVIPLDALKRSPAAPPAQLAPEDVYRKALTALLDADLVPSGLREQGWKESDLVVLAEAIRLGSQAVKQLHEKYPSAVADAYGNGTMTNIEDSFKLFAGGNLERGCLSHQADTFVALTPVQSALSVKKLVIGKGMEHHAVIIYPNGSDWKQSGVVLDGWPNQSHIPKKMVFVFNQWQAKFFALRYLSLTGPRLED